MDKKNSEGRFLKIANMLILAVLLVTTALLASLQWKLNHELSGALNAQQPAAPAVQAAPEPAKVAAPAPAPTPRRAPASTRNYTQAERPLPPQPPPVIATDVEPQPAPPVTYTPPVAPPPVAPPPEPAPPQWVNVTIPAGTILTARLIDTLRSDRVRMGDRFRATLEDALFADGVVAAPRGATLEGRVVSAEQAGRVSGVAEIAVELDRLLLSNGESVELFTDIYAQKGEATKGEDAAKVGTGAAIGAIIGAIGGGGKGAAIGAASGAGAGTAGVLLTRGKPVILTPETRLSFQLRTPVSVHILPGQSSELSSAAPGSSSLPRDLDRERPRLRRR